MSGKSRHGKSKGSLQSKKKRSNRRSHQVAVAPPQAVTGTKTVTRSEEPVAVSAEAVAATAAPAATANAVLVAIEFPNLPYELRRIGILAAAMLAILILLALILG